MDNLNIQIQIYGGIHAMRNYNLPLIKAEMKVERMAIATHIRTLNAIIPELPRFDGKVINVRFYNHMKEVLGFRVGSTPEIASRHDEALKYTSNSGQSSWIYAQWHRTCTIQMDLDNKRLNATKTIDKIEEVINKLQINHNDFLVDDSFMAAKFEQLERIEKEHRALMDSMPNHIIKEHMRKATYFN